MGAEGPIALTIGTAGHVDHGKTTLVEAVTGINTDRLEEERRRGLSIELGFAELDLGDGRSIAIVDVPGHERFVRTMVAGATGIDAFLLVVAADEGVMPQTREHLAVLDALDVRRGVVALTKCDRADAEARDGAREEASALVPTAPLIEVSAVAGDGIRELRSALGRLAEEAEAAGRRREVAGDARPVVLHVDRSFTLHGIGTVVTGTLWSGPVSPGDRVEVCPRGIEARVRRVQVHNRDVPRALPGQRVALNLAGVGTREVTRGDTVTSAGSGPRPTYRMDVELTGPGGGDLDGQRVQVHHGTVDAPARVVDLGEGLAQLRLESPLVADADDRFVIRRIAPPETIGGGRVLDPAPARHGSSERVRERLGGIRERGLDAVASEERRDADMRARAERPEPADRGGEPLDDRSRILLALLRSDGAEPRAPRALADRLGIEPKEAVASLDRLVAHGLAVRATPEVYYARDALETVTARALELGRDRGELTLPELRDSLNTSRKYAQALLEHLDATKATVRHGDRHVLRRGGEL
jgi:selenocysteine-specific elongation factor